MSKIILGLTTRIFVLIGTLGMPMAADATETGNAGNICGPCMLTGAGSDATNNWPTGNVCALDSAVIVTYAAQAQREKWSQARFVQQEINYEILWTHQPEVSSERIDAIKRMVEYGFTHRPSIFFPNPLARDVQVSEDFDAKCAPAGWPYQAN